VEVTSFSPGLRWAISQRLSVQGRWVAAAPSDGDLLSGYALRAELRAQPRTRLSLAYADAPESSEGLPVTVKTVSLGAGRDFGDQLSLNLTASHETRDSFTRDEVVLGSALRF
jgi:YaiO family outer membrane protein